MGQKINPKGMRVGIIKGWDSQWSASKKDFPLFVKEDYDIRKFLNNKYKTSAISKITIQRGTDKVYINIHTAKPGMVIGQKGAGIEIMKAELVKLTGKTVVINVIEIRNSDTDAKLVANSIAAQLEQRVGFRRAMKQSLNRSLRAGVKGIKIMVGGRLDGAEIARSEFYQEGSLPLQTLRADIDYAQATAKSYGSIGVKVWIYKGEILPTKKNKGGNENGVDTKKN